MKRVHSWARILSTLLVISVLLGSLVLTVGAQSPDVSSPLPSGSKQVASTTTKSTSHGTHYFGQQLKTSHEKQMYVALENNIYGKPGNVQSGVVTFDPAISLPAGTNIHSDEEIQLQGSLHLQRALDAFRLDHPEMYWVTGGSVVAYIGVAQDVNGNAYITSAVGAYEPASSNYAQDTGAIEKNVNGIIAEANKANSHMGKLKTVHDLLAKQIQYDTRTVPGSRSHQITGGLVDGVGVCETYAKSFKLIADRMGYETVTIGGVGISGGKQIAHMWNYVKIEGKWYAVDITWDDQEQILVYDYFLAGSETTAPNFGGETFRSAHIEEYRYHPVSYTPFVYPTLSQTAYR